MDTPATYVARGPRRWFRGYAMGIHLFWVWGCLFGLTSPQWPRAAISPTLAWDFLNSSGCHVEPHGDGKQRGSFYSKCVVPCTTTSFILSALLRAIKGQLCPARRVAGPPATDPSGPCGSASGPLHRLAQLYRPVPGRGSPGTRGGQLVRGLGWTQAMRAYRLRLTMRLLRLVFSHFHFKFKIPK